MSLYKEGIIDCVFYQGLIIEVTPDPSWTRQNHSVQTSVKKSPCINEVDICLLGSRILGLQDPNRLTSRPSRLTKLTFLFWENKVKFKRKDQAGLAYGLRCEWLIAIHFWAGWSSRKCRSLVVQECWRGTTDHLGQVTQVTWLLHRVSPILSTWWTMAKVSPSL